MSLPELLTQNLMDYEQEVRELEEKLKRTEDQLDEWKRNTERVEKLCGEMKDVLIALSILPYATHELGYLDRGIGTATSARIWLRVRELALAK